jgi:hypothetical protein
MKNLSLLTGAVLAAVLLHAPYAGGGAMERDPKGFHGIVWGAPLTPVPDLVLRTDIEEVEVKEYEFKDGPPPFGQAEVESIRLSSINDRFVRVAIRYHGKRAHDHVIAHLEREFGPIDRTPGAMVRGLNQQYNWRGTDTEVNLTYDARRERGFVAIESRALSPRYMEAMSDTGSGY